MKRDLIVSFAVAAVLTVAVVVTELNEVPRPFRWLSLPGFAAIAWIPGFGVHGTSAIAVTLATFCVYFVAAIIACRLVRHWSGSRD